MEGLSQKIYSHASREDMMEMVTNRQCDERIDERDDHGVEVCFTNDAPECYCWSVGSIGSKYLRQSCTRTEEHLEYIYIQ